NFATRFEIRRLCALRFIVTETIFARHEDHRGRNDASHVASIMSGAAHDVLIAEIQACSGPPHKRNELGMEADGLEIGNLLDLDAQSQLFSDGTAALTYLPIHVQERLGLRMTKVDCEVHGARYDVARIRMHT